MTDPQVQAQVDAEQVRLVREALALRRECPATGDTSASPVVRFLPGRPRPTAAEFMTWPVGGWRAAVGESAPATPEDQEAGRFIIRR